MLSFLWCELGPPRRQGRGWAGGQSAPGVLARPRSCLVSHRAQGLPGPPGGPSPGTVVTKGCTPGAYSTRNLSSGSSGAHRSWSKVSVAGPCSLRRPGEHLPASSSWGLWGACSHTTLIPASGGAWPPSGV